MSVSHNFLSYSPLTSVTLPLKLVNRLFESYILKHYPNYTIVLTDSSVNESSADTLFTFQIYIYNRLLLYL